ncbi:MAG: VWA domain-containing protein [Vicinamibacterales bacterium]
MIGFNRIRTLIDQAIAEWQNLRLHELQFWHRSEARLFVLALVGLIIVALALRALTSDWRGRRGLVLPAILGTMPAARFAFIRHAPVLLFVAGLLSFLIAFADPYTALVSREASFPGRRIGLLVDASVSMRSPFTAKSLNKRAETDSAFFTTVAAAERFVKMRMDGKYRDLIGLVEFGNQAYVITPFTTDYENILLSISLIGDPIEFSMFPDQGTIIVNAIDEIVGLYKAFNFLEASGNIMVIFSDGEDTHTQTEGKSLDEVLQGAIDAKIPVYLVRTNYDKSEGQLVPDELWIPAIEKTGGRFYAASSEAALIAAIEDIDKVATGQISVKQYSSQQPRFMIFAVLAVGFWMAAAALKLLVPHFSKLN